MNKIKPALTLMTVSTMIVACAAAGVAVAQDLPIADPGSLAFEQGRWEDVIREYRLILEASPADRMSRLRIAQAQRELGRYDEALATLAEFADADVVNMPEAMIDLERARNLLALGRREEALDALEASDHVGLRALDLLEEADDLGAVRDDPRFQRVLRNVRARVYPCETIPEAQQFDFWLGHWEVRSPDGSLAGHNTITKGDGGCAIHEQWEGVAGSTGTSVSFYMPSSMQWRQVWVGSGGTLIDMTGQLVDGEMRMEGTIEYVGEDQVLAFRGVWSTSRDGRVRQRLEQFDVVNNTWSLWFDGFYRRVD